MHDVFSGFWNFQAGGISGASKYHVVFVFFAALMFSLSVLFLFVYHGYLIAVNRSTIGGSTVVKAQKCTNGTQKNFALRIFCMFHSAVFPTVSLKCLYASHLLHVRLLYYCFRELIMHMYTQQLIFGGVSFIVL